MDKQELIDRVKGLGAFESMYLLLQLCGYLDGCVEFWEGVEACLPKPKKAAPNYVGGAGAAMPAE